eukprot:TRINITY_DN3859_c0_g1_i1.p2 TRINITY_DN3859_c0_g1~~TRINITY_DN3859_c0_g1_i1.p2  ORF type:complete len:163 (+),score=35.78 TRINITY_DN3859_c0_g1_i1:77-565(+)
MAMSSSQQSFKKSGSETGLAYLKGSKVGSATGYISVGGVILGLPHKTSKSSKSSSTTSLRFEGQSEAGRHYREMPYCYASMDRKPLVPYDPNHARSRLAMDDAPVPYKNASTIDFNQGIHVAHKRRFNTMSQLAYTGEPVDTRSNQGMLSETVKWKNHQKSK